MQRFFIILGTLLCLLSAFPAFTQIDIQDTSRFSRLVFQWNQYHNDKNIEGFKNIYATNLLFYGKYQDEEKCLRSKSYFLSSMHVHEQNIISPVITSLYTSGVVKCSFIKQVVYGHRSKEYAAYLLFEKRGNKWMITGESDLEADQNMHVQLTPGNKLPGTAESNLQADQNMHVQSDLENEITVAKYFMWILIAVAITIWVIYILQSTRKTEITVPNITVDKIPFTRILTTKKKAIEEPVTITPVINIPTHFKGLAESLSATTAAPFVEEAHVQPAIENMNWKKGEAFEQMIVRKFPEGYYTLINWRSDKIQEGRYARSSMDPDIEFRSRKYNVNFAIECKYRKDFYKGTIEWAKDYQLRNYRRYQQERNIPVFIMIGVGREPANPDHLYVIPLNHIHTTALTREELFPYKRFKTGDFYYNAETNQVT